jgi:FkbM family methyltransferase
VLGDLSMTCLDIGARGGITDDLLPLARAVDACGFEPDDTECARLNQAAATGPGPWRSLRFVPTALSQHGGPRTLHLTRHRGSSSLLVADAAVGERFSRSDYFVVEDTAELDTMPLDTAATRYRLTDAVYMKIDVEGLELEVLNSAPKLLSGSMLAIRCEVLFLHGRQGQPFYADIEMFLRGHGFVPMEFLELHHWRRSTKRKHPVLANGPHPYSRGQLAHGDMLFFRDPETMPEDSPEAIQSLLKAAFIALAYEHLDHAAAILRRPAVAAHLQATYGLVAETALSVVSRTLVRRYREQARQRRWAGLKSALGRRLGVIDT